MKVLKMASHLVLVALALALSANVGKSQSVSYEGTFTLPFEVRWGVATLPPGDYTLRVDNIYGSKLTFVQGEGMSAMVLTGVRDRREVSNHSQLDLVETANGYAVKSLEAGQVGLSFDYAVPRSKVTQNASNRNMPGRIEVAVLGGR